MSDMSQYPFIPARWYTPAVGRAVDLLVVHSMEAAEKGDTAERIANYFAAGCPYTKPDGSIGYRKASAHFCVDADTIIQCVQESDIAYHAPGANHNGIGMEHAGHARQTADEWADPYSERMLRLSAKLADELCARYGIPRVWLSPEELREGKRGLTSHWNVSIAFGKSSHWDPGANFPVQHYLAHVNQVVPPIPAAEPKGWEDMFTARALVMHPDDSGRGYVLDARGGIHALGAAPKATGGPYFDDPVAVGLEIVEWSDPPRGYVLDGKGGVHPFGGAPKVEGGPYWP